MLTALLFFGVILIYIYPSLVICSCCPMANEILMLLIRVKNWSQLGLYKNDTMPYVKIFYQYMTNCIFQILQAVFNNLLLVVSLSNVSWIKHCYLYQTALLLFNVWCPYARAKLLFSLYGITHSWVSISVNFTDMLQDYYTAREQSFFRYSTLEEIRV